MHHCLSAAGTWRANTKNIQDGRRLREGGYSCHTSKRKQCFSLHPKKPEPHPSTASALKRPFEMPLGLEHFDK